MPARRAQAWRRALSLRTLKLTVSSPPRRLDRAREAAGGRDIRVGGGAATVRQYLQAGLVDEMHLAISPVLLGSGEALLPGIDLVQPGLRVKEYVPTPLAAHVVLAKG